MSNTAVCSLLAFILCGYSPLTTLAQSQNPSGIRTSLTDTDPVDVGTVVSGAPDSVTVKNELFTRVFRINGQTIIRRVGSTPLQIGDFVTVRCHFDDTGAAIADSIEANIGHWEGKITKVLRDTVYIKFDAPVAGEFVKSRGNRRLIQPATVFLPTV